VKIIVKSTVPEKAVSEWAGQHPTPEHYTMLASQDIDIYGPDGQFAAGLRANAINKAVLENAYEAYHFMKRYTTDARSKYSGIPLRGGTSKIVDGRSVSQFRTADATGKTVTVKSAIGGYFDKQGGRMPFCRTSAMLQHYPDKWKTVIPCIEAVDRVLKSVCSPRHSKQMEYVRASHPAWVIGDSSFTTITVNNCVAAAYHQDAGDLKDGMGAMLCYRKGEYAGAELVIPQYRIAFDMHMGDVLVFNPTLWHGNVPFSKTVGTESEDWERITIVHYYRKGITGCLSPEDELKRAKQRGAIDAQ
jgi:hypothetical protein